MIAFGKVRPGSTLYIPFETFASSTGAPITITNFAVGDIQVYKNGGTTQRASTSGIVLLDTDGVDFDAITGIQGFSIDLSDNTTAGFYTAGARFFVVVSTITVDSQTMSFLAATFVLGYEGAVLDTTVATLSTQTSFTLTTGPADNSALVGCQVIVSALASAVQFGFGFITAYTGATKTVTLDAGATFTLASGDQISIFPPVLLPTSRGRTLDVSATGEAGVDWANVGSPTTSLALTGTTIATTQQVDVNTIKTNPVVNAGTITFPTGATLASTTNITAGTVATATNVTTVNGLAAGVITATSIAADAITDVKVAADVTIASVTGSVGSVTGAVGSVTAGVTVTTNNDKTGYGLSAAAVQAVWDVLTSALTTVGSIGKLLVDNLNATITSRMATYTQPTGFLAATFPSGTVANTTNITAGTITTVTNLTNAATAGDLTATMKASVTTAATAATPIAASVSGAVASVTGNVGGNVVGSVASVTAGVTVTTNNDKTGYGLSSSERSATADAFLDRDMSTGTDSGSTTVRTTRQALRFLRNRWAIATATLTVYKEDDVTASWSGPVTTDAAANPVTGVNPVGP